MKKIIFYFILLLSTVSAFAQITVTSAYVATLGDTVLMSEDTIHGSSLNLGSAGGNQLWDFSSLVEHDPDGFILQDPSTAPLYTNFPEADFVINDLEDSTHLFFKQTSNALDVIGVVEYDSMGNPEVFDAFGSWRFMQFPATQGTTFSSNVLTQVQTQFFGVDFDSIGPHPYIDSLRAKISFSFYNEFDAWGDVKLPQGTYSCVRQKILQTLRYSNDCYYNGNWHPFTPLMLIFIDSVSYDTLGEITYRWWSDNSAANLFVAEASVDSNDNSQPNVTYLNARPDWPDGVGEGTNFSFKLFPNPTSDRLTISTNFEGNLEVTILDISARPVLVLQSKANTAIDLRTLQTGTYLVMINSDQGQLLKLEKLQIR
ncbi:MAG: T9SS type A sorting domain-containing protein [Flavobacteriales bacterium]